VSFQFADSTYDLDLIGIVVCCLWLVCIAVLCCRPYLVHQCRRCIHTEPSETSVGEDSVRKLGGRTQDSVDNAWRHQLRKWCACCGLFYFLHLMLWYCQNSRVLFCRYRPLEVLDVLAIGCSTSEVYLVYGINLLIVMFKYRSLHVRESADSVLFEIAANSVWLHLLTVLHVNSVTDS